MSGSWNDFNDAKQVTNLIPKGTIAKVQFSIRPGGHDDPAQGVAVCRCCRCLSLSHVHPFHSA
jgi:hypothetical protein